MSDKPTEVKPSSGELTDELESFRIQWKQDLKSQRQPIAVAPQSKLVATAGSVAGPAAHSSSSATSRADPTQRRRQSQSAREGHRLGATAQAIRDQDDGFRSIDLDVKPSPSLGQGERTLTSKPLVTALDHYEAALEEEEEGNINESLRLYRKAHQLDRTVHQQYKEKHFPQQAAPAQQNKEQPSAKIEEPESEKPSVLPTEELIPTFASIQIIPGKEINLASLKGKESYRKPASCPISKIPREILIQIMFRLAEADVSAFVRCTSVCKTLCYLVYTERQIWKTLCERVYENMIWGPSWACEINGKPLARRLGSGEDDSGGLGTLTPQFTDLAIAEEEEYDDGENREGGEDKEKMEALHIRPYDEIEILKYNSSYRRMFIERARIRYNGIYISTCTYIRSGHMVTNSLAFSNPVHLITYYRYIRFFPSGFILTLLTPAEPADVVHAITLESYKQLTSNSSSSHHAATAAQLHHVKHLLPGRWRILFNSATYPSLTSAEEPGSRIQVEAEGSGAKGRYINILDLTLKMRPKGIGGKRGYGDRLAWNSYTSLNRLTDDKAAYTLKNDKPFYFSRVKSYEKEDDGSPGVVL
ncbi:hypothetical protein H072_3682 [Dactylellina haptotyla CBS 200.50]|uniref:F-box domain-containing protein n=1 Tax=Dactylellina haptotyla (strain CBS 200.50) TaxID=1284197 RepID=S8BSE4_DACHA|nr:hypothetical protein H072_3682 [Dactylellina haptotyla CBS 200.50]